jgi:hypothetical protein
MNEDVTFALSLGGFIVAVAAVLIGGALGASYLDCRGFGKTTGIETQWNWGCYAKVNGEWVPKDYVFGDAHELRGKRP